VTDQDALDALLRSAEASESASKHHGASRQSHPSKGPRGGEAQRHPNRNNSRARGDDGGDVGYYGPSSSSSRRIGEGDSDRRNVGRAGAAIVDVDDEPGESRRGSSRKRPNDGDDERSEPRNRDKGGDSNSNPYEEKKIKPDFGLSGALSRDAKTGNVYKGVVLKFREPPEARAPNAQWRLYVYKSKPDGSDDKRSAGGDGDGLVDTLHVSRQSAYLFGRHPDVCDVVLQHPSCSSQHAVLQYRAVPHGPAAGQLRCVPYIMDLESTNGTYLNGIRIDPARYYQVKAGDVLSFGASTREYVMIAAPPASTASLATARSIGSKAR
jgi:smad nuclear-interacting protein 1